MLHWKALVLTAGLIGTTETAAMAMPPAQARAGYDAGASVGVSVTNGTKLAADVDLSDGLNTGFLGSQYTDITASWLRAGKNLDTAVGSVSAIENLVTLGVKQPLPVSGSIPVAAEAGLSYLHASADFPDPIGTAKTDTTGLYLGARATSALHGQNGVTGMFRYHFLSGGIWQAGAGLFGPLGRGSGLFYQIDYYHTDGRVNGFSANTDSILFGIRFSGGV